MKNVILALILLAGVAKSYDYNTVLRLSLMFYEAQRSGHLPENNRIPWRNDSATTDLGQNGEDLSGGYYDGTLILFQHKNIIKHCIGFRKRISSEKQFTSRQ